MNEDKPGHIQTPIFKLNVPGDSFKIQPLPNPTGQFPYRLNLSAVVPDLSEQKMVFHMVGDTGSAKQPRFQRLLAGEMTGQYQQFTGEDQPRFLFHLGDVVYHFGEAEEYYRQFFDPYRDYPGPIFAIAGNHDSDVNPAAKKPYKSLDAFMKVFCDTESRTLDLAQDTKRKSNIQPNIYYSLNSPLAYFICLYSNVPKFGYVDEQQERWFVDELKFAARHHGKAIIVCIHHAPFSADANHGSSREMITFLERSFRTANVWPHIVFSGHVHNYQRFTYHAENGKTIPFIVAGAGGYVTLFPVIEANEVEYTSNDALLKNVHLENWCDYAHGFMKVIIEKNNDRIRLTVDYFILQFANGYEPRSVEGKHQLRLFDQFTIDI